MQPSYLNFILISEFVLATHTAQVSKTQSEELLPVLHIIYYYLIG